MSLRSDTLVLTKPCAYSWLPLAFGHCPSPTPECHGMFSHLVTLGSSYLPQHLGLSFVLVTLILLKWWKVLSWSRLSSHVS